MPHMNLLERYFPIKKKGLEDKLIVALSSILGVC